MARYSNAAEPNLAGRITMQIQRDEPLVEVVVDPDRRRHDTPNPGGDDREPVAEVEEHDRLVLGQNFLQPIVVLLAVGLDTRASSLLEQLVHLGVRVADAVQLVGRGLGRVPDVVLIRVRRDAPGQNDRLEVPLLDVPLQQRGPLDDADLDLDADVLQRSLDDLGDLPALLAALSDQEVELERHAVLHEDAVGVLGVPPGLRQQRARLAGVVWVLMHVRVVLPRAGLVRAGRLTRQPEAHSLDQLTLVDRVGERLAHAPVGEARIAQVHAEVDVDVRRVLVLVVRLAKGRIFGLPLELERGELGAVHTLGLELQEGRRRARDDAIDDARDVRLTVEVVRIGDQDDLFARLPLLEQIGPGSDRLGPVLRRLAQLALAGVRLQQVLGQHPDAPALQRLGVGMLVADLYGVRVHRVHRLDGLEVAAVRGRRLRIDHRLVREDDVGGGERLVIVPLDVAPKLERQIEAVAAVLPGLGQLADEIQILVVLDEAVVHHPRDLERRPVGEHVRDQAGDVPLQRLDVGIAVGRLARSRRRRGLHGVVRLASAAGQRDQQEQAGKTKDVAATHRRQRGWAGAGDWGVGVVGTVGSDGADGTGTAGFAGALAGGGTASRTTELPRSPPSIASVNDVSVKTMAMPVVILPSKVGVPIEPKTAWLPAPPNAEPMSAPLPDCSRTMPMIPKHASTWMMVRTMCTRSLLG